MGNPFNIEPIEDRVRLNYGDIHYLRSSMPYFWVSFCVLRLPLDLGKRMPKFISWISGYPTARPSASRLFLYNTLGTVVITTGGNLLLSLLISVITARVLGPEGKGQYVAATMAVTLAIFIVNLGVGQASIYYLRRGEATTGDVLVSNSALALITGTLATLVLWVAMPWLQTWRIVEIPAHLAVLVFAMIPMGLWEHYLGHILLGQQRFIGYNLYRLLAGVLTIPLSLFFYVLLRDGLAAFTYTYVICSIVPVFVGLRVLPINWRVARLRPALLLKEVRYGIKVALSVLLKFIDLRLDVFIISALAGSSAVGFYTTATAMANLVDRLPSAAAQVLFPKVADRLDRGGPQFTALISRTVLAISALLGLAIALSSNLLIAFLYEERFLPAVMPLWILLPGTVAFGLFRILTSHLSGCGHPEYSLYTSLVSATITITLDLALIPVWGILGAAAASTISYMTSAVLILLIFTRFTGMPWHKVIIVQADDFVLYRRLVRSMWAALNGAYSRLLYSAMKKMG